MPIRQKKRHTILYFFCSEDGPSIHSLLVGHGYHVLASSNGFEAMELGAQELVDAVVMDLGRNHAEVAVIARRIKHGRPQVPTIVLAEARGPVDDVRESADVIVPKADHGALVQSLQKLLGA